MRKILSKLLLLTLIFQLQMDVAIAQNFSKAESGNFKRLDAAQLKDFFAKEVTLRRVGAGQNDDLVFKPDGQHTIRGYTRNFEEKGKWDLKGDEICWSLPSSSRCRFFYLSGESWRLVSDTGEIRSEGIIKR